MNSTIRPPGMKTKMQVKIQQVQGLGMAIVTVGAMVSVSLGLIGCNKTNPDQLQSPAIPQTYTYPQGSPYFPYGTGPINPTFPVDQAPPGQGPDAPGADWAYGGTADFYPLSSEVMNNYVGTHPLNAPKNIKINVNLVNVSGNGIYAGQVQLAYDDAGVHYNGYFDSGMGKNSKLEGSNNNGFWEAQYNVWSSYQGKNVFSGFFQDEFGAVVLVIDNVSTMADAQGNQLLSGSLWFKNFVQSNVPQSPYRKCWYISTGPYNCQSNSIMTKSSPYPSNGFIQLGTFKNLIKQKAFNEK